MHYRWCQRWSSGDNSGAIKLKHKIFTKKRLILLAIIVMIVTLVASGFWFINKNNKNTNKPNPTPGSGKQVSQQAKEAEQKQQTNNQQLSEKLAEAPKDPKARCEISAKFNAEQQRNEQIEAEKKRHAAYIKKFGDNRAEQHVHNQNLERIDKQFNNMVKNTNCN